MGMFDQCVSRPNSYRFFSLRLNVFFGNNEDDPSPGSNLTDEDAWTDDDDEDDEDEEEFLPWLWH